MLKLRINPQTGANEWVDDGQTQAPQPQGGGFVAPQGLDLNAFLQAQMQQQQQSAQMRDAFNRDATFGRNLGMSRNNMTPQNEWASMFKAPPSWEGPQMMQQNLGAPMTPSMPKPTPAWASGAGDFAFVGQDVPVLGERPGMRRKTSTVGRGFKAPSRGMAYGV